MRRASGPVSDFLNTSFSEVTCKDGFRCVSSTRKFGRNHPTGGDVASGDKSATNQDPEAEDVYEWGCPYDGTWQPGKYRVGNGADECTEEGKDCLCISRSSSDFTSTMANGKEVIKGEFGVDTTGTAETPELAKLRQLKVIPHYAMRKLPEAFDVDDPHSDMGQIVNLPQKDYVNDISMYAPKMQHTLDKYHKQLEAVYAGKVQGQEALCGEGSARAFSNAEAEQTLGKIRRFQILSQDCEAMRDNIGKLAATPELERFDGKVGTEELQCFKEPGGKGCKQLNCYNGADDVDFRNHLAESRRKLEQCRPEVDATEANSEPPPMNEASQQGVGLAGGLIALAAPPHPRHWKQLCKEKKLTEPEKDLMLKRIAFAAAALGGGFL